MQEHKLDRQKIEEARRMFCPQGDTRWWEADETRGGVAITIKKGAGIEILEEGKDLEGWFGWLLVKRNQEVFGLCNIYNSCNPRERRLTWARACSQLDVRYRWVFGGDLNFIEQSADKQGGVPRHFTSVSMEWHEF